MYPLTEHVGAGRNTGSRRHTDIISGLSFQAMKAKTALSRVKLFVHLSIQIIDSDEEITVTYSVG